MNQSLNITRVLQLSILVAVANIACSSTTTPITPTQECTATDASYDAFVAPLMQSQCTTCHSINLTGSSRNNATVGVNFDTEDDVLAWEARIVARAITAKTMPVSAPLSKCDRERLAAYFEANSTCAPDCEARTCGDDGCGGSCGTCDVTETCDASTGTCACTPACDGKECGDDGCGSTCGTCIIPAICSQAGQCETPAPCVGDCTNKVCGDDDGCGTMCTHCTSPLVCNTSQGSCVSNCTANCTGKQCGDDGCGGSCGTCVSPNTCTTNTGHCDPPACVPNCTGKVCGDDGCGGSCGTCTDDKTCSTGTCVWPTRSFATDVYPLIRADGQGSNTCGGGSCHSGAVAPNLSSSNTAYTALVGQFGSHCNSIKIVTASEEANSFLVNALRGTGTCSTEISRMPKGRTALTISEINIIRAWIANGALNN